jgi:hypothetical protein
MAVRFATGNPETIAAHFSKRRNFPQPAKKGRKERPCSLLERVKRPYKSNKSYTYNTIKRRICPLQDTLLQKGDYPRKLLYLFNLTS